MPLSERDAIGPLLRAFRRAAALSQEELAERAGVSARAISDLERGQRSSAHLDTLRRLADALGLASDDRGRLIGAAQASRIDVTRSSTRPDSVPNRGRPTVRLPTPLTSFVGRGREVEQVLALLRRADVRLVTLTGPGGVGKTRLALQVAAALSDEFADGVDFVDLSPVRDPALVLTMVAAAVGVRERSPRALAEVLAVALKNQNLLLILDNFEHVVEAAPVVVELLAACSRLAVLATSRARLRLRGEREVAVPPLGLPEPERIAAAEELGRSEAVRLFVARGQETRADFALANENAQAVAEVVRRLDGLPLAIELAAARVKLLPPPALLVRLDSRLALLTGGGRDLPARQRTMRGAIAWSYDLLPPAEQALFRRLSVFRGGCSLEAAAAVCGAAEELGVELLDGLASLIDKSLARQEETAEGEPRILLLETIAEFGLDRLAESGEVGATFAAHANYFLALADEARSTLTGPAFDRWMSRLEREHDNLRATLEWAKEHGERAQALRLAGAIWRFWLVRGYVSEGRARLAELLEPSAEQADMSSGTNGPTRAAALHGAGMLAFSQGDYAAARALHEQALEMCGALGDQRCAADALLGLGDVAYAQGEYAAAQDLYEQSLAIRRELGDRWGVARALASLGQVPTAQGNYAAARAYYQESLAIQNDLGDRQGAAASLWSLGWVAWFQGDYTSAAAWIAEGLQIQRELGDKRSVGLSLNLLGDVHVQKGDYGTARPLLEEGLAIYRDLEDRWGLARSLSLLGELSYQEGDSATARHFLDQGMKIYRELGERRGTGRSLSVLGRVALDTGDLSAARSWLLESLEIHRELNHRFGLAHSLDGLAALAAAQGRSRSALNLAGAAAALRDAAGAVVSPAGQARLEQLLAPAREALGVAGSQAAWMEGRTMSLEQAARAIAECLAPDEQVGGSNG